MSRTKHPLAEFVQLSMRSNLFETVVESLEENLVGRECQQVFNWFAILVVDGLRGCGHSANAYRCVCGIVDELVENRIVLVIVENYGRPRCTVSATAYLSP